MGKGSNTRVTDHYRPSTKDNPYTKNTINKLKSGGFLPIYIVYNKTLIEENAYNEEINAISFIKDNFGNILTNLTSGGDNPLVRIGKDNNKSKPVYQYNKDTGEFIAEYESASLAAKHLGSMNYTHLCACCRGERKTFLGFIWKYEKVSCINVKKDKWDRISFSKLIAYKNDNYYEFDSMKEAYKFFNK